MILINEHPSEFMAMIDTYGNKDGTKWDDIIFQFEWTFEYQSLLSEHEDTVKEILTEAGQNLKFCFDKALVKKWIE